MWFYKGSEFSEDPKPYFGFVYLITELSSSRKYIGRKYFWAMRTPKGKTRRQKQESDWRKYYSSNVEIKQAAKLYPDEYRREILHLCKTRGETNFREVEEQFKRNVLYDSSYINDNINRKVVPKECGEIPMRILATIALLALSATSSSHDLAIRITEVIDGDTIRAELVGAPEPLNKISIRLLGIDTPETRRSECAAEKELGDQAKQVVTEWLERTQEVELKNLKWDKFGGRVLANVYFDGVLVSEKLIEQGLGVAYFGKKKTNPWCP